MSSSDHREEDRQEVQSQEQEQVPDNRVQKSNKNQMEEPSSFLSWANFKVGVVNIVCGTLNGYSIGFVGVYSTIYGFSTNCDDFKAEKSCTTLSNADCVWTDSSCVWKNQVPCKDKPKSNCEDDDHCTWDYDDKDCKHKTGYSSVDSGIFAGAMIVGCMISSTFAGPIVKRLGPKISFLIIGIVGVICSVLYHISTAVDQFWVLCAARLVIGLALGLVNVAAPMYVIEHAHPTYAEMIGVLFQVFTTFGIFLAALMGLLMGQTIGYSSDSNQHLMGRMQGLCVFSTLLSLIMCMLGIFLGRKEAEEDEEENAVDLSQLPQYTYGQMAFPLLIAFFTAGTLQLTGINAVMNYAPTIMKALGTAPLVGNFIVMVWNFVTTIVSIPLARVFSMRTMFLGGSLVTSVACLLLCGIPVYPGVASDNARNGVAITGILIFIAFFEFGVGPCFYILAQQLFPRSFRPRGSSFTMMWQFIFNVIINVCYPIATEGISGGASGDQNKGQAVAFIFFGGIGLVCFIFEVFFLYPWPEEDDAEPQNEPVKESISESPREPAAEADSQAAEETRPEEQV